MAHKNLLTPNNGANCKSTKKRRICHSHESGNPVFFNMLQKFLDSRLHGNDDFCKSLNGLAKKIEKNKIKKNS